MDGFIWGSDYEFACRDTIQIKGSVCHWNYVDRIVKCYALQLLCQWFSVRNSRSTLPTSVCFFFFTFVFFSLLFLFIFHVPNTTVSLFTVKPFCNLSLPLSVQPHLGCYVPGGTHTQWQYSIMVCIILLFFFLPDIFVYIFYCGKLKKKPNLTLS